MKLPPSPLSDLDMPAMLFYSILLRQNWPKSVDLPPEDFLAASFSFPRKSLMTKSTTGRREKCHLRQSPTASEKGRCLMVKSQLYNPVKTCLTTAVQSLGAAGSNVSGDLHPCSSRPGLWKATKNSAERCIRMSHTQCRWMKNKYIMYMYYYSWKKRSCIMHMYIMPGFIVPLLVHPTWLLKVEVYNKVYKL